MAIGRPLRRRQHTRAFLHAVAGIGLLPAWPGVAAFGGAVVTDGTVGPAKPLAGPTFKVTPDLGKRVGPNLFHSFQQLDLSAGEVAEFSGPASVSRVFARVTGGAPSSIDGTLRSTIPAADFYLMNPAGVVFGPNAALDVKGSFAVTTADYIKLADGGRVDARVPTDSVLTSAPPAAFGFLGPQKPAAIQVIGGKPTSDEDFNTVYQPSLTPLPGQSLTVIGGDIFVSQGAVQTRGAPALLVSVGSAGEVALAGTELASPSAVAAFEHLGTVSIANGGLVGSDGGNVTVAAADVSVAGGDYGMSSGLTAGLGELRVSARTALAVTEGGYVGSDFGGNVGLIHVAAGDVRLTGTEPRGLASSRIVGGTSGVRIVAAESVVVTSGASLTSAGGDLTITARDVIVEGKSSRIFTEVGGDDNRVGNLSIAATGTVRVSDGAFLGSEDFYGYGVGTGRTAISAGDLLVDGGASGIAFVGSRAESGRTGDVVIDAVNSVRIVNQGFVASGALGTAEEATAGTIKVHATELAVGEGGTLGTAAPAGGGGVTVNAERVSVSGGGTISARAATGASGPVAITADEVRVDGRGEPGRWASIFTLATGAGGVSGSVRVDAGLVEKQGLAAIGSGSFAADGINGPVNINAGRVQADERAASPHVVLVTPAGHTSSLGSGPNYVAADFSDGIGRGDNTFFTFERLDLAPFESLNITGLNSNGRTLIRVTGGQPTVIAGSVAVSKFSFPPPETWLIGPGGFTFEGDARLAVPGPLVLSTGGHLLLGDNGRFDAADPSRDSLTSDAPTTLGLPGQGNGSIVIRGAQVTPAPGSPLLVLGGNIRVDGGSLAGVDGGAATIASIAASVEVPVSLAAAGSLPDLGHLAPLLGSIAVSSGGVLGSHVPDFFSQESPGPVAVIAGSLQVSGVGSNVGNRGAAGLNTAVQVEVSDGVTIYDGGSVGAFSTGSFGDSGSLRLVAGNISVDNGFVGSRVPTGGVSRAGPVDVTARGSIVLTNGGLIVSDGSGGQFGGSVNIAAGSTLLEGRSIIGSFAGAAGGGPTRVQAVGSVTVSGGSALVSAGGEVAGVTVVASDILVDGRFSRITSSGFDYFIGDGLSGPVDLRATGKISVTAGGFVGSVVESGTDASDVSIEAFSVLVEGGGASIASRSGKGRAGDVIIKAGDTLRIADGATVASAAGAGGTAGRTSVEAVSIELDGRQSASATGIFTTGELTASGPIAEPDLLISASQRLTILNGAAVGADSFGASRAGIVRIVAPEIELQSGGAVTARSFAGGPGGEVVVEANSLRLSGGSISSSNFRGTSDGGRVTITAHDVLVDGGGDVSATAGGALQAPLTVRTSFDSFDANNIFLISPSGARIQLDNRTQGESAYGDGGDLLASLDPLSRFTAKDLVGDWRLVLQPTLDASRFSSGGPTTLTSWSLELGGELLGRTTTPISGISLTSSLNVAAGADPGLTGGRGGDVVVSADRLSVLGGSAITAGTLGTGAAGNVVVNAGTIALAGGGRIDSGTAAAPGGRLATGDAGGVSVRATSGVTLDAGAAIASTAAGSAGGDVLVVAPSVALTGGSGISADALRAGRVTVQSPVLSLGGGSFVSTDTVDPQAQAGRSSDVSVQTSALSLDGGSRLSARTAGAGPGGTVRVGPLEGGPAPTVSLAGGSVLSAETAGAGPAGGVSVEAATLSAADATVRSTTAGPGAAGSVTLRAAGDLTLARSAVSASTAGGGAGGSVRIEGGRIVVRGGSVSAATAGPGGGGGVALASPGAVSLGDGAAVSASTAGGGAGGTAAVTGGSVDLTGGSAVTASSAGAAKAGDATVTATAGGVKISGRGSAVLSSNTGGGDAGTAAVTADARGGTVLVAGGGQVAATAAGAGAAAGTAAVTAGRSVRLSGGAQVTTSSDGPGGDVAVTARRGSLRVQSGSVVSAAAGAGGNVKLTAADTVAVTDSRVTARVTSDQGGRIDVDPRFVLLSNSVIDGRALGGRADVPVTVDPRAVFLQSADSRVLSNRALLPVTTDVAGALAPLAAAAPGRAAELAPACGMRVGGSASSFLVAGAGGAAPEPDSGLVESALDPNSWVFPRRVPSR
jgi:filamentous hemagglutinin family protein